MTRTTHGSFRLFQVAGIDVFLHWSWFLVAAYEIFQRQGSYSSLVWNAMEYVSLFGIVLLHEFGHSLACRQVGGRADRIILWPLGGVAFVQPPFRAGATFWSVAAGPLVNAVLAPIFLIAWFVLRSQGFSITAPDAYTLLRNIAYINLALLIFNLLPIYPLDGGQIFRTLIWFAIGPARSLIVASVIGFLGVGLLILAAVAWQDVWLGIMAVFIMSLCWKGLQQGLALARMAKAPLRNDFACPSCGASPRTGIFWRCSRCGRPFDTFETGAACPFCASAFAETTCMICGRSSPIDAWVATPISDPGNPPTT